MMTEMDSREIKSVFTRIGWGVALFMLISQLISGIVSAVGLMINPDIMNGGVFPWLVSYLPLYLVAFPIAFLVFHSIPDREAREPEPVTLTAGNMAKLVLIAIGITYALNIVSTLIQMVVIFFSGGELTNPLANMLENSSPWMSLLMVVIVAPVMEEIIFRRIMYNKLMVFGPKVYIGVSAFLFAMFHGNINQLLYAFVLGVVFAGLTYYTGTIKYSIILHIIVNFIGSGVSILIMSLGNNDEMLTTAWGGVIMVLMVVGLITGIIWWKNKRHELTFEEPIVEIEEKKVIFLNSGMIVYTLLMASIIVSMLLIS